MKSENRKIRNDHLRKAIEENKKKHNWMKWMSVLCAFVLMLTTITLIFPASALSGSDLQGYLNSASISGKGVTVNGDTWNFTSSDKSNEYGIQLVFKEKQGEANQFPKINSGENSLKLAYQLPAQIQAKDQNGTTTFTNSTLGLECDIAWEVKNGELIFTIDNTKTVAQKNGISYTAYGIFDNAVDAHIDATIKSAVNQDASSIEFSSNVRKNIENNPVDPGALDLNKEAWVENGVLKYKITATASNGDVSSATIYDTLTNATGITYNPSSLTVTGNWQAEHRGITKPVTNWAEDGKSFNMQLSDLKQGDAIYIAYSCNIDYDTLDQDHDGKIDINPDNTVTDGNNSKSSKVPEYSRTVTYTSASKTAGTASDVVEESDGKKYRYVPWTVTLNPSQLENMSGSSFTDALQQNQNAPMTYAGDGITVTATNANGSTTKTVKWNQSDESVGSFKNYNDASGWKFTFPENAGQTSYTITYQTKVDISNLDDAAEVKNQGTWKDGTLEGKGIVGPDGEYGVEKKYLSTNDDKTQTTWEITMDVPAKGLINNAEVSDTVPSISSNGKNYVDKLVSYEVDSKDLLPGETYSEVEKNDWGFKLRFYKDTNKTQPGLQAASADRKIHIKVVTALSQEWLQDASANSTHANKAKFNNSQEVIANKSYANRILSKTVEDANKTLTDGNVTYRVLKYTLNFSGITGPITFHDELNIQGSRYWTGTVGSTNPDWDNLKVWGDYWSNPTNNMSDQVASITANGNEANFDLTAAMKKTPEDSYYPYYKLVYYALIPEDTVQTEAAENQDLKAAVVNTASWGDEIQSAVFNVPYKAVDKQLLNENDLGGNNHTARYQIIANPKGATVNNGEPYELTDTFSDSLAIDYSTIQFSDPSAVLSYEITGNSVKFWIVDGRRVEITYNAEVIVNESGNITISNTASTKLSRAPKTSTKNYNANAGSGGSAPKITIQKVDGDNAKIKLAGVKFVLHSSDQNMEAELRRNATEEQLTFTTGEDGSVDIFAPEGSGWHLYYDTPYYLQEDPTSTPEGYYSLSYNPAFTISQKGKVDWDNHIFYNNYVMQIKNYRKSGNLQVTKTVNSSDTNDKQKEFEAQVTFYTDEGCTNVADNLTGTYGDVGIVNGVAAFKVKDGSTINISKVPEGLYYRVVETAADGFKASYSGDVTGQITENQTKTANITNTPVPKGTVTKKKAWAGGEWPDNTSVTFTLKASIDGENYSPILDNNGQNVEVDQILTSEHDTATWTNLPETVTDENGDSKNITYNVEETKVTITKDGKSAEYTGKDMTDRWTQTDDSEVITNTPKTTDFSFTKYWKDTSGINNVDWVKNITVTLHRTLGTDSDYDQSFEKSFELSGNSESGEADGIKWSRTGEAASGYTFTFKSLPAYSDDGEAYTYSVSEGSVDGYKTAYADSQKNVIEGSTGAGNGGYIINTPNNSYELPITGGSGTMPYTASGSALIALAAIYAVMKHRHHKSEIDNNGGAE